MVLLLDAANTIIYKPKFYDKFIEALKHHKINLEKSDLRRIHKIISEVYHFPDRTSEEFYEGFNKELLYSLGIIAKDDMLQDIFKACSYLEWERFEDAEYLTELDCPKAILSNFNSGLSTILNRLFPKAFNVKIISENTGTRKPNFEFFKKAIDTLGVKPSEIIYVGDSIKLDLEPGLNAGMNAWLIDRDNYYPYCSRRISNLKELKNLL